MYPVGGWHAIHGSKGICKPQVSGACGGTAAPSVWYYCANPQGYYPYVQQCPGGWRPVAPTPPDGAPTNHRSYRGNAAAKKPATTSSSTPSAGGSASKASITRSSTAETTPTPAPPGNALVE